MNFNHKKLQVIALSFLMLVLILDPGRGLNAALNGIDLCLKSVIPGIFPFLFLCGALARELNGYSILLLERTLHIPSGTTGYFLIGLLCGYPVGAKLLQDEIRKKNISSKNGVRMMTFCNNASPAFIIGILSSIFSNVWIAITIWLIQIFASLFLGALLPGYEPENTPQKRPLNTNLGTIMNESIKAISSICGWVVLFAILLAYIQIPLGNHLGAVPRTLISGFFELTNGIYILNNIHSPSIRFTVCTVLLSFGGLCILLQTRSVAPALRIKSYVFGRFLHAGIAGCLASIVSSAIFRSDYACRPCIALFFAFLVLMILILHFNKKMVAFSKKL